MLKPIFLCAKDASGLASGNRFSLRELIAFGARATTLLEARIILYHEPFLLPCKRLVAAL